MKIISETGVQTKLDMYVLLASIIVIDFLFLFSDGIFHFILGQSVVYKLLVYIPLIKDHFHCTSHTLTRRVPFLTCVNNIKTVQFPSRVPHMLPTHVSQRCSLLTLYVPVVHSENVFLYTIYTDNHETYTQFRGHYKFYNINTLPL